MTLFQHQIMQMKQGFFDPKIAGYLINIFDADIARRQRRYVSANQFLRGDNPRA